MNEKLLLTKRNEDAAATSKEIDATKRLLRVERQFLHRLPKLGAILFQVKTYLYTLGEVKAGGMGDELAQAIDGLVNGNAPDMVRYKGAVVWREAVKAYLRNRSMA
ncbi:MAG: hypothetical protein M1824_005121 [Vezdaea acicularis]|nr:MAG: hypothetical protein M1824_005121 [Vezdaea acicularis]